MKTSKFALLNAFANGLPIEVRGVRLNVVNQLQREDGSNTRYNVTGISADTGTERTLFTETYWHTSAVLLVFSHSKQFNLA